MTTTNETTEATRCARCGEPQAAHRPSDGCRYNGWRNYETWNVALWIDNDQGSHERARELTGEAYIEALSHPNVTGRGVTTWTHEQAASYLLSDTLKEWVESSPDEGGLLPEVEGMAADLLGAALSEVDWREIAEHYLADVDDERAKELREEAGLDDDDDDDDQDDDDEPAADE